MVGQDLGRYGELLFAMNAIENGLNVLHPDSQIGYDFVVEYQGKFTRVQVKSTLFVKAKNIYAFDVRSRSMGSDVYVFVILNEGVFVMYKTDEVKRVKRTFTINLNFNNNNLNNWDIFKT